MENSWQKCLLRWPLLQLGTLFVLGLLIFGPTLRYPFVHDDVVFIKNVPEIRNRQELAAVFWQKDALQTDVTIAHPYYRPFLVILQRLQYAWWSENPAGYHSFNLGLHLVNAFLIYFLFLRFWPGREPVCAPSLAPYGETLLSPAFILAVLFLIHPVQSEAVACVSGVSNLLVSFWCLVSLLCSLSAEKENSGKRYGLIGGSWLFFIFALLTKEQAIIFPLFYLAVSRSLTPAFSVLRSKKTRHVIFGGLVLIACFYLAWRANVLGRALPAFVWSAETGLRVASIPRIILQDMGLLIFPSGLHYYRSINILSANGAAAAIFLLLVIDVIIILSRMSGDKRRLAILGLVWFFLTLLPVIGFIPLIHEYSWIAAFEHFLYLPSVGFWLFLWAIAPSYDGYRNNPQARRWWLGLGVSILFVLSFLTYKQNTYWRAEVPLFERAVRFEPELGRVRILLARAYYFNKQYQPAVLQYRAARDIMADYESKVTTTETRDFYRRFLRDIEFELAHCYEALGQWTAAMSAYERALVWSPADSRILNNLGVVYLRAGYFPSARKVFEQAVRVNPSDMMAKTNWAFCLIQEGKREEAKRILEEVLVKDGKFGPAMQNLEGLRQGK